MGSLLKRRQVKGDDIANATAHMLLQVVAKSKWQSVDQLLAKVSNTGLRLAQAAPTELVIGNVVRRVMGLIRDEATEERNADEMGDSVSDLSQLPATPTMSSRPGPTPIRAGTGLPMSKSMFNLLCVTETDSSPATGTSTPMSQGASANMHALRSEVIDGIEEIMDEISQADDQIAGFADIQIHPGDYVLAYLPSPTVERFLIKAAAKRRFTVFLASGERQKPGEAPHAALRKKLNGLGVNTISLASNGLMAYMPRVNKVVIGAKAVYANGGVSTESGCSIAARAAREYSKPVIVLSGVYKFTPADPSDDVAEFEQGDSSEFVDYADGEAVDALEVENIVAEYLPAQYVDVYLTNL